MTTTEFEAVPAVDADAVQHLGGTVVMKFGGTSVGDAEKLRSVARRLVAAREQGNRVVGVLSAMGHTTDELLDLARQISERPHPRELDMLVSVGERISCALAAMAIFDLGHEAISLTGSQAGIVTDTVHGKAKIVEVRARRIHEALDDGKIVLVAGFQGVSTAYEVTTLGRGGTDLTAAAVAAALGADACEIYTDVEGVFTADPRIVPGARKLHAVTYDEMLEMAASGAKVLQLRSVEFARNHGVRLHVRSTFSEADGTWITQEDERMLEKAMISGVTHTLEETVYRVEGVPAATLFTALAEAEVNVDTIVQTDAEIVFSAPVEDREDAARTLDALGVHVERERRARQGQRRRRRHEVASGDRGEDVLHARRAGDRAAGGDDLADQDRVPRRPRRGRAGRRSPARRVRARPAGGGARRCLASRASASSARPAPSARSRSSSCASAGIATSASSPLPDRPARSSAGTTVEEATPEALAAGDLDLCLFSVGTSASRELVPHAVRGGALCVDKSAAFRLEPGIPLVVPEVNGARAAEHDGIVANPNCCAIPLTIALKPLLDAAGLRRVRVSTYQSVSGAGRAGDGAAPRRVAGGARSPHGLELRRRRVRGGGEAPRGDAQDPRAARPPDQRHLRPRARPRRPCRGSLGRDGGAALA